MTIKRGEKDEREKRGRDGGYLLCPRREDGARQMYKGAEGIHEIQDERKFLSNFIKKEKHRETR